MQRRQSQNLLRAQIRLNQAAYWSFLIGSLALLYAATKESHSKGFYEKLAAIPMIGGPIACLPLKKWPHVHRLSSSLAIFSCTCLALRAINSQSPDQALLHSQMAMIAINLYQILMPKDIISEKINKKLGVGRTQNICRTAIKAIDNPLAVGAIVKLMATIYTSSLSTTAHKDAIHLSAFILFGIGYLCQSISKQPNIKWGKRQIEPVLN